MSIPPLMHSYLRYEWEYHFYTSVDIAQHYEILFIYFRLFFFYYKYLLRFVCQICLYSIMKTTSHTYCILKLQKTRLQRKKSNFFIKKSSNTTQKTKVLLNCDIIGTSILEKITNFGQQEKMLPFCKLMQEPLLYGWL